MTFRRTKIVATLGPASSSPEVLEQLILSGLDVARLNFSHGTPDDHKARAALVRELAAKHGRHVALLGDLQVGGLVHDAEEHVGAVVDQRRAGLGGRLRVEVLEEPERVATCFVHGYKKVMVELTHY